jgi:hypothetical protein
MNRFVIFILLLAVDAQAQSLADVARAERERQQRSRSALKVEKVGEPSAAMAKKNSKPAETVQATTPAEAESQKKSEPSIAEQLQNERVDIIKKRSELLVRLDQTKDPEIKKSLEAQLMEIAKRAENVIRRQRAGTTETPKQ